MDDDDSEFHPGYTVTKVIWYPPDRFYDRIKMIWDFLRGNEVTIRKDDW